MTKRIVYDKSELLKIMDELDSSPMIGYTIESVRVPDAMGWIITSVNVADNDQADVAD